MIIDAVVSMDVPNDKRPWLQAGRVLRAAVGLGLGVYALVPPRTPRRLPR